MNTQPSPIWTHLTSEGRNTGTWRSALPVYQNQPSPCHSACPVHGEIAAWIRAAGQGDLHGSWLTLVENNPFPAIAGRICHHPCESSCNRADLDASVGICSLERFVGDTALNESWSLPAVKAERPEKVAVVGGGPAGLSAAYQLRRNGLQVTLFEAGEALGGLMRTGIPAYRLARDVLEREVARVTALGIDVRLNAEVEGKDELAGLRKEFDAVFLATGASLPKRLPVLDYDAAHVMGSAAFLASTPEVQKLATGAHVLVVGGGSAALDVARTARRLGREVTVMSLESEGQLPAQAIEMTEACEEGVHFLYGARIMSVEISGTVVSVQGEKVDFQPANTPGDFAVTPVPGSTFTLPVHTIIPAIGQDADLSRWDGLLNADGPVISAAAPTWRTNRQGIYAGGDVASTARFVTHAIGMGKEAAFAIIAALDGADADTSPKSPGDVGYDRINVAYHTRHGRNKQAQARIPVRLNSFDEVQQPLTSDAALSEASRCFSCGTCIHCDNCYFYCPDMAITRLQPGYDVKLDYCKGCGLCVAECPTGSVHMQEEDDQ